ncbi:MAG: hypothetical protein AB7P94_17425 [Steroidobacteraceae bacterium]
MEWRPHAGPQELALRKRVFELLYGGARGGGKTEAGIVWIAKTVDNPRFRGLVIRNNADDLKDWIDRARYMYSGLGAEFVGNPTEIKFPSGAKIRTGHLKDDNAYGKYLGHEYQRMLVEELTQIASEERYVRLISSCRSTVDKLDARVFATTNPGGPGHGWVKKRFVDPAPPNSKFIDHATDRSRIFIPAKVEDNPTLMRKDPGYVKFLNGLPEELRKAWRDGSWDVFIGMFFPEFDRDYHIYNPSQIEISDKWQKFRSIDWGYHAPMACYWHAIGPDNHIYTYREYYEIGKTDTQAAKEIAELSAGESYIYSVGDPQSFPVKIEKMKFGKVEAVPRYEVWADCGVHLTMGDSSRIKGWSQMRDHLKVVEDTSGLSSRWHISNQCTHLINEIGTAIYDKKNIEDMSGTCADHALESCRLALMSRQPLFKQDRAPISNLEAAERQMRRHKANEMSGFNFK